MSNVIFKFRRRPQFIVFNTIIPMILLAFMSCLTFYVSIDAGEKIGYCLTVMLAYAVYLTIVSDNMPTTTTHEGQEDHGNVGIENNELWPTTEFENLITH
jgi:type IV secretory pathway VirB3-like protein